MDAPPELTFEKESYSDILAKDRRYDSRAYDFVLDVIHEASENAKGHVSGQELLSWFRDIALDSWGPMAYTVLADWGVTCCEDVGEMMSNLAESRRVGRDDDDTPESFLGGYDFQEAFLGPFAV